MSEVILEKMRREAVEIFQASLEPVNPYRAVQNFVRRDGDLILAGPVQGKDISLDLQAVERVFLVGGGKATAAMARAVEDLLGDRVTEGIINVKYGFTQDLRVTRIQEAGHPVPDEPGIEGASKIMDLLRSATEKDLIFSLISGGGSALLCQPSRGITLLEKQALTRSLLACGASIDEINAVRKHISQSKGGQMARAAFPATTINLMLSDVVGDKMDVIASGPFVPDPSTFQETLYILEKYQLKDVPLSIQGHLEAGAKGQIPETPKTGDPAFDRVHNIIVGSNILALEAAADKARDLGYGVLVLSSMMEGETRVVAQVHTALAQEIVRTGQPIPAPACLVSGGETTVTIRGKGRGGRNQEFCLAAALEMEAMPDHLVILSAGTDGNDGPTDAAGAVVDPWTVKRGLEGGMEARAFLNNNDSYPFLEKTGDLLKTGPTNTNVMDVRLVLVR